MDLRTRMARLNHLNDIIFGRQRTLCTFRDEANPAGTPEDTKTRIATD